MHWEIEAIKRVKLYFSFSVLTETLKGGTGIMRKKPRNIKCSVIIYLTLWLLSWLAILMTSFSTDFRSSCSARLGSGLVNLGRISQRALNVQIVRQKRWGEMRERRLRWEGRARKPEVYSTKKLFHCFLIQMMWYLKGNDNEWVSESVSLSVDRKKAFKLLPTLSLTPSCSCWLDPSAAPGDPDATKTAAFPPGLNR